VDDLLVVVINIDIDIGEDVLDIDEYVEDIDVDIHLDIDIDILDEYVDIDNDVDYDIDEDAQKEVFRQAADLAGINPHHVFYVDAIDTKVGDPIEANARSDSCSGFVFSKRI